MTGGGAGGKGAAAPVPPVSRKLVQSLKEIVNCPEAEIYAALRECSMDADEAVSLLLSQGPCPSLPPPRPIDLLLVSLFLRRLFPRFVIELEGTSVWFGGALDQHACVDLERFVAVKVVF
jgi:hypothetical protein